MIRAGGRSPNQLREVKITYDVYEYAAGSVLFEIGKTRVLCAVNLQQGVPAFLKGQKTGWLTAEYSMLPASTTIRTVRDDASGRRNGRAVEISRLIGRSLRSVVDLSFLGERTIVVDCDVLQADGGTRAASITGACLALARAVEHWIELKIIKETLLTDRLTAISVGITQGTALLDVDFAEDSTLDADFNFVFNAAGDIIEMQGSAERAAVSWPQFEAMRLLASQGAQQLLDVLPLCSSTRSGSGKIDDKFGPRSKQTIQTAPLFSLKNR